MTINFLITVMSRERQISDLESQVQLSRGNVSHMETEHRNLVKQVNCSWICCKCRVQGQTVVRSKLVKELLQLSNNYPEKRYTCQFGVIVAVRLDNTNYKGSNLQYYIFKMDFVVVALNKNELSVFDGSHFFEHRSHYSSDLLAQRHLYKMS